MRIILTACMALGAATFLMASPGQAQVTIRAPGVAIDAGHEPYWRSHNESAWERRSEFHEAEHRRPEWLREHCVREWNGQEVCRR
jgi:hypothetical protein